MSILLIRIVVTIRSRLVIRMFMLIIVYIIMVLPSLITCLDSCLLLTRSCS